MTRRMVAAPALLILALTAVAASAPATAAPLLGAEVQAPSSPTAKASTVAGHAHHVRHHGRIVWVNASTLEDVDVTGNLLIANSDGSHQRELTDKVQGVNDADPSFSPDGRLVAWARNSNDTAVIYVIRASGGTEHALDLGCSGNCLGDDKPTWISDTDSRTRTLSRIRPTPTGTPASSSLPTSTAAMSAS